LGFDRLVLFVPVMMPRSWLRADIIRIGMDVNSDANKIRRWAGKDGRPAQQAEAEALLAGEETAQDLAVGALGSQPG
jgi:hypothetical protein